MKKFLKLFSAFALIFCCMFSFVGCDMFEGNKSNDYAELVAEREIVREVFDNAKEMLEPNIEQEEQSNPTSLGIAARDVLEDSGSMIDNCIRIMDYYFSLVESIINSTDFVPGKLYNAKIVQDAGDEDISYFFLMNAYCDGDDKVTLNLNLVLNTKDIEEYSKNSVIMAYDIYYNSEYQPTKTVEYNLQYAPDSDVDNVICKDLTYSEMMFSKSGEVVGWYQSTLQRSSGGIRKAICKEDLNGLVEFEEEDFTEEMNETFDAEIEVVKEKTYLFNFARPLSQDALNELSEAFNRND